jgi:hypothetical protein
LYEEFNGNYALGDLKEVAGKTIKELGLGMETPVRVRDVSNKRL